MTKIAFCLFAGLLYTLATGFHRVGQNAVSEAQWHAFLLFIAAVVIRLVATYVGMVKGTEVVTISLIVYALCLPLPSLHDSDFYEIFFVIFMKSSLYMLLISMKSLTYYVSYLRGFTQINVGAFASED